MIEIVRHHARRVEHWQYGEMALRWTAAGMLAAEGQFRRVKGYRQLPALLAALEGATADQPGSDSARHAVAGSAYDATTRGGHSTKFNDDRDILGSFRCA